MRFTPRLATAGDHMLDPQDLISHMKEYTSFLADLSHVRAEVLLSPMAVNKWSAQTPRVLAPHAASQQPIP